MEYGVISTEIPVNSAAELFRKTGEYGFSVMQFNFSSVLGEELPAEIPDSAIREIAGEAAKNGIKIAAISGTFNMAHQDPAVRAEGIKRFEKIAASCRALGCGLASLCTGSRSMEWMWAHHPDNNTPGAWKDMRDSMEKLIVIAEKYDIYLGIETEASNVVDTPQKAKKLIDELQSPRLKIIMDAANLFRPGMAKPENVRSVIAEAFGLLGTRIALAHGKDIKESGGISFTYAGNGIIDFGFFINELEKAGYKGGFVLHGIKDPKNIPGCLEFIKKTISGI